MGKPEITSKVETDFRLQINASGKGIGERASVLECGSPLPLSLRKFKTVRTIEAT
jgi:hypothetical protein